MLYSGVYAYVTLKEDITEPPEDIIQELKTMVKSHIASYAVPQMVQVGTCYCMCKYVRIQ